MSRVGGWSDRRSLRMSLASSTTAHSIDENLLHEVDLEQYVGPELMEAAFYAFQKIDKDQDGFVNATEISKFLSIPVQQFETLFEGLAPDSSLSPAGPFDHQTFVMIVALTRQRLDLAWAHAQDRLHHVCRSVFNRFDTNKRGYLTEAELDDNAIRQLFGSKQNYRAFVRAASKHGALSSDGSDPFKLSFDEFHEQMKTHMLGEKGDWAKLRDPLFCNLGV